MTRKTILTHPFSRRVYWCVYTVLFYKAGLNFTTWLLQPDAIAGLPAWCWVVSFPPLFVGFFFVGRRLGCTAGECAGAESREGSEARSFRYSERMPGI